MRGKTRVFVAVSAAMLALTVIWPGGLLPAFAWDDDDCASCHGEPSISEEGGAYLFVDPARFERTAHADVGCTSCHETVSEDHPYDEQRPSRAGCGECHDDIEAEYAESDHGENADCTDCHNPHNVHPLVGVSGIDVNSTCMECHEEEDVVSTHGVWLLQPVLHIRSLPCIACHTTSQEYSVTFYVESVTPGMGMNPTASLATHDELLALSKEGKDVASAVDLDADGQVSFEELKTFYFRGRDHDLQLWGMMTPEGVTHGYTTLDNRWDCTFCHGEGSETMEKSYVALPGPLGNYTRIPVKGEAALGTLFGNPDFYMIGATRSKILTLLGFAIVLGGLAVPVFHGTLRLLTMRNRKREK